MKGVMVGGSSDITIERSRFIGVVYSIEKITDVKKIQATLKKQYHDASHIPYAYIHDEVMNQDDDGEPSGTAGIPLLNLLRQEAANEILLVVIRFFGGKKLGTKRLRQAFIEAGKAALHQTSWGTFSTELFVTLEGPLEENGELHHFIAETGARTKNITYNKTISATLIFTTFDWEIIKWRLTPNWKLREVTTTRRLA